MHFSLCNCSPIESYCQYKNKIFIVYFLNLSGQEFYRGNIGIILCMQIVFLFIVEMLINLLYNIFA